jgi:hypothetical protein
MTGADLDETRAIATFLDRVGRFTQVALLTDQEVQDLFGPETAAAMTAFDSFSRESGLCASCGGECCREIGCEVYSPLFHECPIHDTRPLLCRFHFCHRFDAVDKLLVIALRDVFMACYTADQISSGSIALAMSVPPLENACPILVANVQPVVESVRDGRIAPGEGIRLIRAEVKRYRKHHPVSGTP